VAERSLAEQYYWGSGVKQSDHDAFAWFYSAALQDDTKAEEYLGYFYRAARGISRNYRDSYVWYYRAATKGDRLAQSNLGDLYYWGNGVQQSYTDAFAWFYTAALQDDSMAERYLGSLYQLGRGVSRNDQYAFAWYFRAATRGDAVAQRDLAEQYYQGEGVKQSDRDAFAWFYSAALQDDSEAEQYLGFLYRKGRGVDRSYQDSYAWYYRSAERNDPYGEWGLAYMYQEGLGVKPNIREALRWYQKAYAALPDNERLTKALAHASLKAFEESPDSTPLDSSLMMKAFRRPILIGFFIFTAFYVVGGIVLFFFTFRTSGAPPGIFVAIGWIVFFLESQGVAMLGAFIFGKSLSAGSFFGMISLFSGLPVLLSSCGSNRNRVWKASPASWKALLLYGIGACVSIFIIDTGYQEIYTHIFHGKLPSQPTKALITNAVHGAKWIAFVTIAFVMPITEEIIFRGYFFDALRKRWSGKIAIPVTAFAFASMHFQGYYFVPLFGFGLVLGWLRFKTDSVRLPMFLHALNNFIATLFVV
jgi:TPR repeat protein/membrane protease YdiL (CAAX protease family)